MKFSTGFIAAVVIGPGMSVFASPAPKNPPPPIASSNPSSTLTLLETNNPQTPSLTPTDLHDPPNPQFILLPHPENISPSAPSPAAVIHPRAPQQTCAPNSGTNNSGCNNSGLGNSGTSNSGINNCGTGNSGVGVGCSDAAVKTSVFVAMSATTVYVVSTVTVDRSAGGTGVGGTAVVVTTVQSVIQAGATATQTIVLDMRGQKFGCDYWKTQGYTCSLGSRRPGVSGWWWGIIGVVMVGVVLL
ncbi:hypothetical protein HOY82DRAFT_67645 [Tuber indicum]|nr:hypothetical protein HOY82DRAFT_67645 [Tuber indicum]